MEKQIEDMADEEYYNKYGICREDVRQILWENSDEYQIWRYTHR